MNLHWLKLIVVTLGMLLSTPSFGDGGKIPANLNLKGLHSGKLTSKQLKGKPTVMIFFASWCTGCSDVMEKLTKIKSKNAGFAAVSVDETVTEAKSYFKNKSKSVKKIGRKAAYFDKDAELASKIGVEALPTVVVVDAKGNVIEKITGHPSSAQYKAIKSKLGS